MNPDWWCKHNDGFTFRWEVMFITEDMDLHEFIAHLIESDSGDPRGWYLDFDSIAVIGDCEFMLSSDYGLLYFKKME